MSEPADDTAQLCPECGHEHAGPQWAGICIGCPCEWRPEMITPEDPK